MSNIDIIRAWKDEEYRNSLSEEQRSQLPENPAGMIEMSNDEMESVAGGLQLLCPTVYIQCATPPVTKFIACNSAIDACPTALICGIKTRRFCIL